MSIFKHGLETEETHRSDFRTCPFCGKVKNTSWWIDNACDLVLEPAISKPGFCAVHTECPACFEKSWAHIAFSRIDGVWAEAAEKYKDEVQRKVFKEWGECLCRKCKNLNSAELKYVAWRKCTFKAGQVNAGQVNSTGPAQMECEFFEPNE